MEVGIDSFPVWVLRIELSLSGLMAILLDSYWFSAWSTGSSFISITLTQNYILSQKLIPKNFIPPLTFLGLWLWVFSAPSETSPSLNGCIFVFVNANIWFKFPACFLPHSVFRGGIETGVAHKCLQNMVSKEAESVQWPYTDLVSKQVLSMVDLPLSAHTGFRVNLSPQSLAM